MANRVLVIAVQAVSLVLLASMAVFFYRIADEPGISGMLFGLAFNAFPLLVTQLLALLIRNPTSQVLALAAQLGYTAWFVFIAVEFFTGPPDGQAALVWLVVGAAAAPVLAIAWLGQVGTALWAWKRSRAAAPR